MVLKATPAPIHPDGHGVWTSRHRTTPFFLEYDRGTEPLTALLRKLIGYAHLAADGGPGWPVLCSQPTTTRERHLHQLLADQRPPVPVATAVHGQHPAHPVWAQPGDPGHRRHLRDLPTDAD